MFTTKIVCCPECYGDGLLRFHNGTKIVTLNTPCPTCVGAGAVTKCAECDVRISPDLYGRVPSFVVWCHQRGIPSRNLSHGKAHALADALSEFGAAISVEAF